MQVLTECLASLGLVRGVPDEEFHMCLSALRDRAEEAGRGFLSVEVRLGYDETGGHCGYTAQHAFAAQVALTGYSYGCVETADIEIRGTCWCRPGRADLRSLPHAFACS